MEKLNSYYQYLIQNDLIGEVNLLELAKEDPEKLKEKVDKAYAELQSKYDEYKCETVLVKLGDMDVSSSNVKDSQEEVKRVVEKQTYPVKSQKDQQKIPPSNQTGGDEVRVLSYNTVYNNYTNPKLQRNATQVINIINNGTDANSTNPPQIMFLCEAKNLSYASSKWYKEINLHKYGDPSSTVFYYDENGHGDMGSVLYWDPRVFELYDPQSRPGKIEIFKDRTLSSEGTKSSTNRRYCISVRLRHRVSGKPLTVIGVHLDHGVKSDNPQLSNGLEYLLEVCGYEYRDSIILMGDFNDFYQEIERLEINGFTFKFQDNDVTLKLKQTQATCCGVADALNHPGQYNENRDPLFTNIDNLETIVIKTSSDQGASAKDSVASDHYPVIATFDPKNL